MRLEWEPLPEELQGEKERLQRILNRWENTPYQQQSMVPGVGVDCVRFACRSLDEAYGLDRCPTKVYPADAAMHSKDTAMAAMRWIIRRYEPCYRIDHENEPVQGFDLVVAGPPNGGPGHAMLVSPTTTQLWHIAGPHKTVRPTTMNFDNLPLSLFAVYRCKDREEHFIR